MSYSNRFRPSNDRSWLSNIMGTPTNSAPPLAGPPPSIPVRRHDLQRQLVEQQETIVALKAELSEYKNFIAASTVDDDETDSNLRAQFDQIFMSLQMLVLKHLRGVQFACGNLDSETKEWMKIYIPQAPDLSPACNRNIILSLISRYLTKLYKPSNHFGWDKCRAMDLASDLAGHIGYATAEDLLHSECCPDSSKARPEEIDRWLDSTRSLLMTSHPVTMKEADRRLIDLSARQVGKIFKSSFTPHTAWTPAVDEQLTGIFSNALDFFRLLRRQRTSFAVWMIPASKDGVDTKYDTLKMEDVSPSGSEDEAEGHAVEISVFPGLWRLSEVGETNAFGGHPICLPRVAVGTHAVPTASDVAQEDVPANENVFTVDGREDLPVEDIVML